MDQRNALAAREYGRNPVPTPRNPLICPKPRRVGSYFRPPLRRHTNQLEVSDLRAGAELVDLIRAKGSCGPDRYDDPVASSPPPFFSGSPPCRVSNPVVQDEHFRTGRFKQSGFGRFSSLSPATVLTMATSSPSPSARKGGSACMKFSHKPAAVRIEGFDCLGRDRQNCSISAVA